MSGRERRKGLSGEAEVAAIWRSHGWTVRGLEATGDQLALRNGVVLHSECKRQEVARPWLWWQQASGEAPVGTIPVVPFRRSRSPWLVIADLHDFAREVGRSL